MSWEVPTMRSATSFFNPALSKSLLRRFWPLTAFYGLVWALLLPLREIPEFLTVHRSAAYFTPLRYWNTLGDELQVCVKGGTIMAFIFGIFFAMAMFSYLTVPRATSGLHALPARRETLFWTAYLTGLGAQTAVQLCALALSFAVMAGAGYGSPSMQALGFAGMFLPTVWFYSFGVLCMVFAGQILAAPVFYGVLSALPVGIELLVTSFAGNFLYGWGGADVSEAAQLATPIYTMLTQVRSELSTRYSGQDMTATGIGIGGWPYLLIYAAVGALVTVLALLVYKKRHSEETGTTVAVRWARPIFQYGVTFCTALALGQLLYLILFDSVGNHSRLGSLACMIAAGLIGFFTAEMLLKKTVRVWRTGWKGALIVAAVMATFGFGLTKDITGYEGYQPRAESIRSVTVDMTANFSGWSGVTTDDPEMIRLVLDAHRALIRDKARQQELEQSGRPETDDETTVQFSVRYLMPSGRVVRRSYDATVYRSELSDPDSPASRLLALYVTPDFVYNRVFRMDDGAVKAMREHRLRITGGYMGYMVKSDDSWHETELTAAQAQEVLDAIERDLAAGRGNANLFGYRRTLSGDEWDVQMYGVYSDERGNAVSVTLYPEVDETMTETVHAIGQLREAALNAEK